MHFLYGAQDWKTRERGQEDCYLLTNGLGGFSSTTIVGSNTRNDHSVLMACVKAPNNRMNIVNHLKETLLVGENSYSISTQDYVSKQKTEQENGFVYQLTFRFEDYPEWTYLVEGVEIQNKEKTPFVSLMKSKIIVGKRVHLRLPHIFSLQKREKIWRKDKKLKKIKIASLLMDIRSIFGLMGL